MLLCKRKKWSSHSQENFYAELISLSLTKCLKVLDSNQGFAVFSCCSKEKKNVERSQIQIRTKNKSIVPHPKVFYTHRNSRSLFMAYFNILLTKEKRKYRITLHCRWKTANRRWSLLFVIPALEVSDKALSTTGWMNWGPTGCRVAQNQLWPAWAVRQYLHSTASRSILFLSTCNFLSFHTDHSVFPPLFVELHCQVRSEHDSFVLLSSSQQ